jgi:hypothetical protein
VSALEQSEALVKRAEANHARALEVLALANSNFANCVPWRFLRWLRVHDEVKRRNEQIRAEVVAIRAERHALSRARR